MSRSARLALLPLLVVLLGAVASGRAPAVARGPGPLPDPVGTWPLNPVPEVLAGFDPPSQPWNAGHRGVDLAGTAGQAVRVALAGTVRYAGRVAGRGVVAVDHGETRTTYEPVSAAVEVGAEVTQGQVIGTLETAGSHCLPRSCLHWGLLHGAVYLDPLSLVAGAPVRLLPLDGTPLGGRIASRSAPDPRDGSSASGHLSLGPAGVAPPWLWEAVVRALALVLHAGHLA